MKRAMRMTVIATGANHFKMKIIAGSRRELIVPWFVNWL